MKGRTCSRSGVTEVLAMIFLAGGSAAAPQSSTSMERVLVDFSAAGEQDRWIVVTDTLMGGRSSGAWAIGPERTASFRGLLRIGEFGGFVSARCAPRHFDLTGYEGIAVRIRGDGRTYRLRLRHEERFESIAYQANFTAAPGDDWITVRLPFRGFIAAHHGSILPDAAPLDPAEIRQIGVMIADPPEGEFRLEIDWIKAYRFDLKTWRNTTEEAPCT